MLWILPREDVADVDAAAAADAQAPHAGAAAPLEARMAPLTAAAVRPALGADAGAQEGGPGSADAAKPDAGARLAGEREAAAAAAAQRGDTPVVAEVDRRVFARILLTAEMLQHHLPDAYLEALQQL